MSGKDQINRFIFENLPIRGELIRLNESYRSIVDQHIYPTAVKHLLGEAIGVAGLLSAILKYDGRLSVQFRGEGALKLLLAQSDNEFNVRGLAKWDGDITYQQLLASFKQGVLAIMLGSEKNKNQYQGVVSWRGHSLADSIEGYFQESEQLPTKIWLFVDEQVVSGFLLQAMPMTGDSGKDIDPEVAHSHWARIVQQANTLLTPYDLHHSPCETFLQQLFPSESIRLFPSVPIAFGCTCTRTRGVDAIKIIGKEEAEAELKNNRAVVVTCDFCNKEYFFDANDIANIFNQPKRPPNETLH